MNRTAAIVVALLSAPASAGAGQEPACAVTVTDIP